MATEKTYNTSSSESVRACAVEALRCVIEVAINTELLSRSEIAHILRKQANILDGGANDTSKREVFEYRLWREGNKVMFRIYQQPERWRGKMCRVFDEGKNVVSDRSPELSTTSIFLRGSDAKKDNDMGYLEHRDPYEAERYLLRCQEALHECCMEQKVRLVQRTASGEVTV
jgi:hypothetical protein